MAGRIGKLVATLLRAEPRSRPSSWGLVLDAVIAVGIAVGAVIQTLHRTGLMTIKQNEAVIFSQAITVHTTPLEFTAAVVTGLPLALRRCYPITALLVIIAGVAAMQYAKMAVPACSFGAAVFAGYSAVANSRYRNLAIATVLAITLWVTATFATTLPRFPERLTALFAMLPTMVAAVGIRELRNRLRDTTARHKESTRRAIAAERERIASELHDVVTHNVSVMIVQAGAARTVLASSPADAEQALFAVEATGRTAMTELRNLLGLLCPAGDEDDVLRPQPGLGELDELIGRVSAAGLPVELVVSGTPRPLTPGADLAAYRVVQEALTNVLRHAGRVATVVMVQWEARLVITVSDDGRVSRAGPPGRGLVGLRERLALYGGELDAGPRPGGDGWWVRAVVPA